MAVENRDDGAKLRGNMSHLDIVSFQASDDITVAMTQINSENKRDSRTNSRSSSYQSSRSPKEDILTEAPLLEVSLQNEERREIWEQCR